MDLGGEIKNYSDLRMFDKYANLFLKDLDLKVYKYKLSLGDRTDYERVRRDVVKYKKNFFHGYRRIFSKENAKKVLIEEGDFEEVIYIDGEIGKLEKKVVLYRKALENVSDLLVFEKDLLDLYSHMREQNISWEEKKRR
jgi:hypothetical protein